MTIMAEIKFETFLLIINFLTLHMAYGSHGAPYDTETQLIEHLMENYSSKQIPRLDTEFPIIVNTSFNLVSLADFDVVHEVLSTVAYCTVFWWDPFMAWNSTDHGNITNIVLSSKDVWKPDLTLKNSIRDYKMLGDDAMFVQVYHTGYVYWYPYQVFEAICVVDVTYFPFDVQRCSLSFVAWSYETNQVVLSAGYDPVYLGLFKGHPIWEIVDTSHTEEIENYVSSITFTLVFKRKPHTFVLSVIAPTILLSVLNLFVFVLPCESGERAGYSITVFLSFVVFFTVVSTMLPENSDAVPIVGTFILLQTGMSALISLTSVTLMRLYFCFDDIEVPIRLIKLATFLKLKPCRKVSCRCRKDTKIEAFNEEKSVSIINTKPCTVDQHTTDEEEKTTNQRHTWKYVVNSLDVLMFYVSSLELIVSTVVCFTSAMSGPDR